MTSIELNIKPTRDCWNEKLCVVQSKVPFGSGSISFIHVFGRQTSECEQFQVPDGIETSDDSSAMSITNAATMDINSTTEKYFVLEREAFNY